MSLLQRLRNMLRRRPPTEKGLAARAEAKLVREQILQDRLSQESRAGQVYRSGRR